MFSSKDTYGRNLTSVKISWLMVLSNVKSKFVYDFRAGCGTSPADGLFIYSGELRAHFPSQQPVYKSNEHVFFPAELSWE